MTQSLLHQILDYANRANPYPLYEELRKRPVHHDDGGPYVVSTYYEIRGLLHDPRISSDVRNLASTAGDPLAEPAQEEESTLPPGFLRLDPPEHDRLRRMTNRPFGPPHSPTVSTGCAESSATSSPASSTASATRAGWTWWSSSPTPSR